MEGGHRHGALARTKAPEIPRVVDKLHAVAVSLHGLGRRDAARRRRAERPLRVIMECQLVVVARDVALKVKVGGHVRSLQLPVCRASGVVEGWRWRGQQCRRQSGEHGVNWWREVQDADGRADLVCILWWLVHANRAARCLRAARASVESRLLSELHRGHPPVTPARHSQPRRHSRPSAHTRAPPHGSRRRLHS